MNIQISNAITGGNSIEFMERYVCEIKRLCGENKSSNAVVGKCLEFIRICLSPIKHISHC